jgi:drug/metabolite transporter (DMT)-like permease
VFRATVLALVAAVLHAGWNLVAKRSRDRFIALWGQFAAAGSIGAIVIGVQRDLPAAAWGWAAICGAVHLPYVVGLARAYDHGDFSTVYPIARGSGALLAGIGGIVVLDDRLDALTFAAVVVVAIGICVLATGHGPLAPAIGWALVVGMSIGVYTVNDSHASRTLDTDLYPFAVFVATGIAVTGYGIVAGRGRTMAIAAREEWRKFLATGTCTAVTYLLVLVAVRSAPVGYVAALRESSVVIAAFLGSRVLAEEDARRRTVAAAVILAGLILLVSTG